MKKTLTVILTVALTALVSNSALAGCGTCDAKAGLKEKAKSAYQDVKDATEHDAEVGCGKCMYDKDDVKGCKTAVKIKDKVYMVKAASKDGECDAHEEGLCKTTKKATLTGKVVGEKFLATKIDIQEKGDDS